MPKGSPRLLAAAELPTVSHGKLDKQMRQMALGEKLDVWIDSSHLVRQISVNLSISGATAQVTGTYENYGAAVQPVAPPAQGGVVSYASFMLAAEYLRQSFGLRQLVRIFASGVFPLDVRTMAGQP